MIKLDAFSTEGFVFRLVYPKDQTVYLMMSLGDAAAFPITHLPFIRRGEGPVPQEKEGKYRCRRLSVLNLSTGTVEKLFILFEKTEQVIQSAYTEDGGYRFVERALADATTT